MYIRKIVLTVVLVGVVVGGFIAYRIYQAVFSPNTAFETSQTVVYIPTGTSFSELLQQLEPLLLDVESFQAVAGRKGYLSNVRPGKYILKQGMNNNEMINTLRIGNQPVTVSFNNQESLEALSGRIAAQIEADSVSLLGSFKEQSFLNKAGFNEDTRLAMYLPNSYEFFWNTSADAFRKRMLKEYNVFWSDDRKAKAKKLGLNPNEVTSLAAIVQKETAKVDERPRVAGVYLNRIRQGMALQADPTVIFAIKKETGNYDTIIKRVLYRDLEIESPYNTYKYRGIPPGPITMPDISSIDAVLNAENHRYLYFVVDVENFGYHKFAESLTQHNRNKAHYVRWLNSQNIRR